MIIEKNIGVIGLGAMGLPMAKNLVQKKFHVTVFDIRDAPLKILKTLGVRVVGSPREVGSTSNIVLTSLPSSREVENVVLGEEGLLQGMERGDIIVDTSTIDPLVSRRLADNCSMKGISMLDAPVSGGTIGAENGTLSIMIGGDENSIKKCMDVLRSIGTNIYHVGGTGTGQIFKLINNMLVAINLVGVSEAFVLGKKAGINVDMLYDVIKTSSGSSWVMDQKFPNMIRDEFSPGFRVWLQDKDLALVMNLASQLSTFLPMASLALQLYESAKANGLDNLDHSAVVRVLHKLSGIPVRE